MGQNRILTLLSDFGLSDPYVGMMKGAIAHVNPTLTVIDLTHLIPPQNIALARFALMAAVPYFPAGSVHVAVVDPGVGSARRAIALAIGTISVHPASFLVGPDNGLFSGVLSQRSALAAIELTNPRYWRTANPSSTFHGRDIFAPVAAHLASGVPLEELGTEIAPESLMQFNLAPLVQTGNSITGCVQATDHFGNLITTIPAAEIANRDWSVRVREIQLPGQQTYSDVPSGELVALVGSHGWVEIAVNSGSAQAALNLEFGASVEIVLGN